MTLRGPKHINEKMKLKPGDRFLVAISYTEGDDGGELEENTPNTCEDMLFLNGRWGIVTEVSDEPETYYEDDGTIVEGYVHYAKAADNSDPRFCSFSSWSWNWFHMEAIDIRQAGPSAQISEALPDA